ncbi:hypothetical protein GCM10009122_36150 [Fulvivirga kasyanovii]|uniref:Uncharacterized protein n=1 Tax=Fulvivirga kasyanovii TaxID=396812 RepID=A0ABW9RJE8_9BACT|nr:hypothetical protein [Fulvivirga kasyanovii]MTI23509.1 hypothetical protein [Fulvivirga kasyanovii]
MDENIEKGWEYFFNEEFKKSADKFEQAYVLDTTNLKSIIGLFYSKSLSRNEIDLKLLKIIPGESEHNFYQYGMSAATLIKYYSTPKREREAPFDFSIDQFKAYHTDGYVKTKQFEGQYINQREVGLWKYYNLGGILQKTIRYSDSTDIHLVTYYSQNKKISEELTEIKKYGSSVSYKVLKKTIFYQELPDKIGEYLFVSDEGFCIYNKESPLIFGENTPDNVIEEETSLEGINYYIWRGGKRSLYLERKF